MTQRKSAAQWALLMIGTVNVPVAGYLAWELHNEPEWMPAAICGLTACICAAMPALVGYVKPGGCGILAKSATASHGA